MTEPQKRNRHPDYKMVLRERAPDNGTCAINRRSSQVPGHAKL